MDTRSSKNTSLSLDSAYARGHVVDNNIQVIKKRMSAEDHESVELAEDVDEDLYLVEEAIADYQSRQKDDVYESFLHRDENAPKKQRFLPAVHYPLESNPPCVVCKDSIDLDFRILSDFDEKVCRNCVLKNKDSFDLLSKTDAKKVLLNVM